MQLCNVKAGVKALLYFQVHQYIFYFLFFFLVLLDYLGQLSENRILSKTVLQASSILQDIQLDKAGSTFPNYQIASECV